MRAGFHATLAGDETLSKMLYGKVIAWNEAQPVGASREIEAAIAHAGVGNTAAAVEHLRQAAEGEGLTPRLIDSFFLTSDPAGAYHGIENDVGFLDVVARQQALNAEELNQIRARTPVLFPSDV